jgi:hypothetical protein
MILIQDPYSRSNRPTFNKAGPVQKVKHVVRSFHVLNV